MQAIVLYQQIPLNAEIDDEINHINQHIDFRKYLNKSLLLNKKICREQFCPKMDLHCFDTCIIRV